MKTESRLRNSLKEIRTRSGMSQQDLADRSGVTRQTISGVESDLNAPSAAVALRIARALGCRMEDLFWLEEDAPDIEVIPTKAVTPGDGLRVVLGRVGNRWVAHPLVGENAFRTEMVPADGAGTLAPGATTMRVRLLDDMENLEQTVFLTGCSPATSLWIQAAQRWNPALRVHWSFANSMAGLAALGRGEVHAAGVHLYDPQTGEQNASFVRKLLANRCVLLINLGFWEEGLLVQKGNPLGLAAAADLAEPGVRIINRESGAGCRQILEHFLQAGGIPFASVAGFEREVFSHIEVAHEVLAGRAQAGVSTSAVAAAFGLGFVPLHEVRYDMAVPKEYLEEPTVRQLFATLNHRRIRSQLEAMGGYNTRQTGEVVATIDPSAPLQEGASPFL